MSAIRTWKQYDKAIRALGCEAEFSIGRYGDMRMCGAECSDCGRCELCEKCSNLEYEIEQFQNAQLDKAHAQSKRKKVGGK